MVESRKENRQKRGDDELHDPILLGDFIVDTYNRYLVAARSICDHPLIQMMPEIEKLVGEDPVDYDIEKGVGNHPRLSKMREVALAAKELQSILEEGVEMKDDKAQSELAAVVILLENLGEQIGQICALDDWEGSRQTVQYLVSEYNRYLAMVLEATVDAVIPKMFRPLEMGDEETSPQAKLSEVRLAQSGLLSYLKEASPARKFLMRDITDDDYMWLQIDVPDPVGEDVIAFYRAVAHTLREDDQSPNAEPWAELEDWQLSQEDFQTIEGWWRGRWNGDEVDWWANGTVRIREIGDWVHILWVIQGGAEVFKARREGNRLMGRHVNIFDPGDSGSWVGLIVNNRRIDGRYEGGGSCPTGRFDFRR